MVEKGLKHTGIGEGRRVGGEIEQEEIIQEEIERITERIKKLLKEGEEGNKKKTGVKKDWRDEECKKKKKKIRRELTRW